MTEPENIEELVAFADAISKSMTKDGITVASKLEPELPAASPPPKPTELSAVNANEAGQSKDVDGPSQGDESMIDELDRLVREEESEGESAPQRFEVGLENESKGIIGGVKKFIFPQEFPMDTSSAVPVGVENAPVAIEDRILLDFDGLYADEREIVEFLVARKLRPEGERQVCSCGHTIKRHHFYRENQFRCSTGQMRCRCKHIRPVFEIQDSRYFMRKTFGPGAKHALMMGLYEHQRAGKTATPLYKFACEKCNTSSERLTVAPFTEEMMIVPRDAEYSFFLCDGCLSRQRKSGY